MRISGARASLLAACAATVWMMGATGASAGTITPPPGTVLNSSYPVSISQVVQAGFIVPGSSVQSTAPGRINLNYCFDPVACVLGYSEVDLGADPTITHESAVTGTPTDYPGGGYSATTLSYSVELIDPGATAPETVGFKAGDVLNATGDGGALYILRITGITNALTLQGSVGNIASYEGVPQGSLASITNISLTPNAVYSVMMEVSTFSGTLTGASGFAQIDPEFFLPDGSAGTLAYSAGVTGAVPEPASWALMVLGMGGLGAGLRARRRRAVAAI